MTALLEHLNALLEYLNALLEYLTALLEYMDFVPRNKFKRLPLFWLITVTALMYYCISLKMVWPWLYQSHHR